MGEAVKVMVGQGKGREEALLVEMAMAAAVEEES
jgi:hypothetical protein